MHKPTSRGKKAKADKRQCHRCHATGLAPCRICAGAGRVPGGNDVEGRATFVTCSGCFGKKTGRCPTCGGERFL